MSELPANSYDEVLYPCRPYAQTHPDRLASIAAFFGMNPAPVERCRVVELGCNDGSNLIGMALTLPGSEFLGVDQAAVPLARGGQLAQRLGLDNVSLLRLDIMDFSQEMGEFDYILAHGLFSWVPAPVQDKLLEICRRNLAPNGVAYVSYNTYPGWYVRQMVNEMMLFHVRGFENGRDKIEQGPALVKFLHEAQDQPGVYPTCLETELDILTHRSGEALFHDELAEVNLPIYFKDFVARAGRHGLRYLAEADFFEMQAVHYPPVVREALKSLCRDLHEREQYLDFLKGRRFRQTLLCRQETALDRSMSGDRMRRLYASARLETGIARSEVCSGSEVEFVGPRGARLKTDNRAAKACLFCLNENWPRALGFDELTAEVRSFLALGSPSGADRAAVDGDAEVAETLLAAFSIGMLETFASRQRFTTAVSDFPLASPLARLQAQAGPVITTLMHSSLRIETDMLRRLLLLLDGSRDHAALLAELGAVACGPGLHEPGLATPCAPWAPTRQDVENGLRQLARMGLLLR